MKPEPRILRGEEAVRAMQARKPTNEGVSTTLVSENGKSTAILKIKYTDGSEGLITHKGEAGAEIEFHPAN